MYMMVSPSLLVTRLLPFVSLSSLRFDSSLTTDSHTGSYFVLPVAKLGPENVTASSVPGCSARAAELWLASSLSSLIPALRL